MPQFNSKLQPAEAGQFVHKACAPDQRSRQGFKVVSDYKLMGDQPQAVDKIASGILQGKRAQTLMGVTGSGKTLETLKFVGFDDVSC